MPSDRVLENVKEYYGQTLRSKDDLKTSACCTADSLSPRILTILKEIHPEIHKRFYGCGSPIPEAVSGLKVLDLGCGSGRDCFVLSQLVGSEGRVIGLDMTDEQLAVARSHVDYHTEKFGYSEPNIEFRNGYIEGLSEAGIAPDSLDLIVSNCVINLSPNKPRVFEEVFKALRPGGELYFSDVFADRRVPPELMDDPVLHGECLAGAIYIEDFRRMLADLGINDFQLVSERRLDISNPEVEEAIGMNNFSSVTVRAFKIDSFEDRSEDYGQSATYLGSIPEAPHRFVLDRDHVFEAHNPVRVCGNTAAILECSRFAPYFSLTGNRSKHFGVFGRKLSRQLERGESCC